MTKSILALLAALFIAPSSFADYYLDFIQVDVQPRLGRIAVHHGTVREEKYVDWMHESREELWKDGIFPDAGWGDSHTSKRVIEMEGQKIELELYTSHLRQRGAGSAIPHKHLKISIDGSLIYDTDFGNIRGHADVVSVEILPASKLISIRGNQDPAYADGVSCLGLYRISSYDIHFFYGDDENPDFICDEKWLWEQIPYGCVVPPHYKPTPKPTKSQPTPVSPTY